MSKCIILVVLIHTPLCEELQYHNVIPSLPGEVTLYRTTVIFWPSPVPVANEATHSYTPSESFDRLLTTKFPLESRSCNCNKTTQCRLWISHRLGCKYSCSSKALTVLTSPYDNNELYNPIAYTNCTHTSFLTQIIYIHYHLWWVLMVSWPMQACNNVYGQ